MPSRDHKQRKSAPGQRQLRVGEEMRHALARILTRGELRDPALQDVNLTVTEVRVAPDLKHATAFVMPLAGQHATEALAGLKRGAAFLRIAVARDVKLRFAPSIAFALDESFDRASHIEAILHRPDVARDLQPDDAAPRDGDDGP
jgi:ribosome-binding factor A